jgi:hypothetical protein
VLLLLPPACLPLPLPQLLLLVKLHWLTASKGLCMTVGWQVQLQQLLLVRGIAAMAAVLAS